MQKTQAQGTCIEDQPRDRAQALQSVLFPIAFPDQFNARCGWHAGAQLGQLSLQKLLELSSQLNDEGSMRLVRKHQRGCGGESLVQSQTTSLSVTGNSTASRVQEEQRSLQDPLEAPVKDVLGRLSHRKTYLQDLQAFQPTRQTVPAGIALLKPPTIRKESLKQTQPSQRSNFTAEPAQRQICKLHRSTSRAAAYRAAAESTTSARSGTASDLLAQHRTRLASASQLGTPIVAAQLSGRRNPLFSSSTDAVASDLACDQSTQQGSSACSSASSADTTQSVSSMQLVQPEPSLKSSLLNALLTSSVLHEHNTAELPMKQDNKEREALSYDSGNEQAQSEDSDSGSFFTDAADVGQAAGYLPDLSSSGTECDDCISVGTSQAITNGSSSMGDADLTEATAMAPKGRAGPLLLPSAMGTASTVAFVGLQPNAETDSDLIPLKCACFSLFCTQFDCYCMLFATRQSSRNIESPSDWQPAQDAVLKRMHNRCIMC